MPETVHDQPLTPTAFLAQRGHRVMGILGDVHSALPWASPALRLEDVVR